MLYKSVVNLLKSAIRIVTITSGNTFSIPLVETLEQIETNKSFSKSQLAFCEGFLKCFSSLELAYDQDLLLEIIDSIIDFYEVIE